VNEFFICASEDNKYINRVLKGKHSKVILIIECDETQVEFVETILWNHFALGVAKVMQCEINKVHKKPTSKWCRVTTRGPGDHYMLLNYTYGDLAPDIAPIFIHKTPLVGKGYKNWEGF
jgi:hypothetical protein